MSFFGGNLIWNVAKQVASTVVNKSSDDLAIVYSVILDENHPLIKSGDVNIADVGSIECRLLNDITGDSLLIAKPLDSTVTILPIRNQTVFIQKLGSGYVYTQISKGLSPNTSNNENSISTLFTQEQSAAGDGNKAEGYSNVSSTGIARSNTNEVNDFDGYGDYFTAEEGIHKLKLYEGDVLFQSRFGQSIRLSGYNNSENKFFPTLTIRSGESPENRKKDDTVLVEENVNEDSNIIFLGSGEKLLEWTLPTTNPKESFFDYPSELKGNQILLSSDRIILSAKTSEMIFSSKGNTGFITDGYFTIDTTKGINVTSNEAIYFDVKNNKNFIITCSGGGAISLGSTNIFELEPAPKGQTLVNLLGEFIDLVVQQIYVTPSGPSAPGPTSVAQFASLKAKLNTMLSQIVQLK
jgi:hypothetical protein|tara:strand:+ start:383 stop:1609 length:1227 start_codon:yes stop_codon:yes gene_type:complete